METIEQLGSRLHFYRKQKGMTLAFLGQKAGVSAPFLSQVERGEKVPSLSVLIKITGALGIKISHLILDQQFSESIMVTRSSERQPLSRDLKQAGHNYFTFAQKSTSSGPEFFIIKPAFDIPEGLYHDHPNEEFVFVLQGPIELKTKIANYILYTGDAAYINSSIPHIHRSVAPHQGEALITIIHTRDESKTNE